MWPQEAVTIEQSFGPIRQVTPVPAFNEYIKYHGKFGDREKPGAERIAILGLGPGDYRGACLLRQVETMF